MKEAVIIKEGMPLQTLSAAVVPDFSQGEQSLQTQGAGRIPAVLFFAGREIPIDRRQRLV
ncbi:hypothetical protein [Treponema endosymbiont of Eucomonympha sp.]|uniref:hypothetical protein n=1 Tax=Treponema endosymbiont of Eucomonympha sp. TaxID=1580831 RepID=UPI0007807388|nr:hypothetical protein [Treponema endosymbiont of Eucomonympha sp.]